MSTVDNLLTIARTELGKPYVYGDEGPNTFDCSGLMEYVFAQVGIHLPRVAADQQKATSRVSSPLPGDLVFFGDRIEARKHSTPGMCVYCGTILERKRRGTLYCNEVCRKRVARTVRAQSMAG